MTDPRLYVSMSSYVVGRLMGGQAGAQYLNELVAAPELDAKAMWVPGVRCVRLLRELAACMLRLDTGATNIGKSLSRHFTAAFESGCDAWCNIDDDCETTRETLAYLLAAVDFGNRFAEPRIAFAPYILRDSGDLACVEWSPIYSVRPVTVAGLPPGEARRAVKGATGLIVMNRQAMGALAQVVGPVWRDDDGAHKYPVAQEIYEPPRWIGADYSLFARVPRGVSVEALTTGETQHGGYSLDLSELR